MNVKQTKSDRHTPCLGAGVFVCVISWSVSIATLPQDLVWGDSPELAASAWVLGVPHPTGYPLYMLAVRLFQALPFGTVIFRAHVFSALCTACAAGVLYDFLRRLLELSFGASFRRTVIPAFSAALAWSLTPLAWSQSREGEVYALFALLFVAAIWLFLETLHRPQRSLPWLAFCIGLMLMHHRLSLFAIILMVAFGIFWFHPRASAWFHEEPTIPWTDLPIRRSIFCFLVPFGLLFYFPLRAMMDPPINWYDPVTFSRGYELVSGKLYSSSIFQRLQSLCQFQVPLTGHLRDYGYLLSLALLNYSLLAVLILAGWWTAIKTRRFWGLFSLILFLVYISFVFFYAVGDWPVFLYPAVLTLAIPLAFGMAQAQHFLERQSNKQWIQTGLIVFWILISFSPAWVRFEERGGLLDQNFSPANFLWFNGEVEERLRAVQDRSVTQYATYVWDQVPDGAPVITGLMESTADNELYPLWYQQIVEHRGEHSTVIGAGFIHFYWYREEIGRTFPHQIRSQEDRPFANRLDWYSEMWHSVIVPALKNGPVYTTSFSIDNVPPRRWTEQADFHYLPLYNVDRSEVPYYYRDYVPRGQICKITAKKQS